ncbi:MAG: glycoside hydrolase family 127 protein, partial [Calditrichaceae bacterium]
VTGKPVPSDLYKFIHDDQYDYSILLNGKSVPFEMNEGYAVVNRKWNKNDVLEINFPMPVRQVKAHELVKDDQGKVSITRGPIVFCAEGTDNKNDVFSLVIPENVEFNAHYQNDLLGGIMSISGVAADKSGKKRKLMLIPYYAWSHRGPGEMAVWLD